MRNSKFEEESIRNADAKSHETGVSSKYTGVSPFFTLLDRGDLEDIKLDSPISPNIPWKHDEAPVPLLETSNLYDFMPPLPIDLLTEIQFLIPS